MRPIYLLSSLLALIKEAKDFYLALLVQSPAAALRAFTLRGTHSLGMKVRL